MGLTHLGSESSKCFIIDIAVVKRVHLKMRLNTKEVAGAVGDVGFAWNKMWHLIVKREFYSGDTFYNTSNVGTKQGFITH